MQKQQQLLEENDTLREMNRQLESQLKKDGLAIDHANKEIHVLKDKYQLQSLSLQNAEATKQHRDDLLEQVKALTEARQQLEVTIEHHVTEFQAQSESN